MSGKMKANPGSGRI